MNMTTNIIIVLSKLLSFKWYPEAKIRQAIRYKFKDNPKLRKILELAIE